MSRSQFGAVISRGGDAGASLRSTVKRPRRALSTVTLTTPVASAAKGSLPSLRET